MNAGAVHPIAGTPYKREALSVASPPNEERSTLRFGLNISMLKSARLPIRAMPAGLVSADIASYGAAVVAPAMPFW